jgi:ubiquinone/menaquinone biosynthesis C-methylase UbiE
MSNSTYLSALPTYDRFTLPILRQMIDWLALTPGQRALDAGCGEGAFALLMAEAGAQVDALDESQEELDKAVQLLAGTTYAGRVTFHKADIHQLPFDEAAFDLVWCSRVLHHTPDHIKAVRELTRVIKPGGRLAVREGGLPLRILPFDVSVGEPGLQDRIQVANNRWFAAMQQATLGKSPFPYGWTRLLREAGLERVTARTFVLDAFPPFEPEVANWFVHQLRRPLERDEYGEFLSADDQYTVKLLTEPDSPHYIINRDDLHVQMGESIYLGYKPV